MSEGHPSFRIPSLGELAKRLPLRTREAYLDPKAEPRGEPPPTPPPTREPDSAPDLSGLQKALRECQNRFAKKVQEVEGLRRDLAKAEKQKEEALKERDRAREEAALLRKKLQELEGEKGRWEQEASKLREALQRTWEKLEEAKREVEGLKARLAEALKLESERARWEEERARLKEALEGERALREGAEARFKAWEEAPLPPPLPQEALFRVLVLDYLALGEGPVARLQALLEGYRAFLKGEDHPALAHSNARFLSGSPEGILLLGLEGLLQDLGRLPLERWLRTYAFRLEALLAPQDLPSSPRLEE